MNNNHTNFTIINNNLKYVALLNQFLHSSHNHMSIVLATTLYHLFRSRKEDGYIPPIDPLFGNREQYTVLRTLRGFGLVDLDSHYRDMGLEVARFDLTNVGYTFLNRFVQPYIDKRPQHSRTLFKLLSFAMILAGLSIIVLLMYYGSKMMSTEASPASLSNFNKANEIMNDINNCVLAVIPLSILGAIFTALSRNNSSLTNHKALSNMTDDITGLDIFRFLTRHNLIKRNLSRVNQQTIMTINKLLFTRYKYRDAWIR